MRIKVLIPNGNPVLVANDIVPKAPGRINEIQSNHSSPTRALVLGLDPQIFYKAS